MKGAFQLDHRGSLAGLVKPSMQGQGSCWAAKIIRRHSEMARQIDARASSGRAIARAIAEARYRVTAPQ